MKARLPHPTHYSYEVHRKQVIRQIILPVVCAALVMIGLVVWISLVTFNQGGDAARWAAISTIWIVIPVMLAGLVLLVLFIGLIYLLARALGALPYYTGLAQDYVYKGRGVILRGANMVVRPILAVDGFLENIRAFFGRITP
jgi:FtsH-binding integral membrane protein